MKKVQLWFLFLLISTGAAFSQACVIDTSNYNLFSPPTEELPCVVRDSFYDITLQVFCPPGLGGFNIDSIKVTNFPNLPTGCTKSAGPVSSTVYPLGRMCIRLSGTTTDTTGYYEILYNGSAYLNGVGQVPFSYIRANFPGTIPDYALTVINAGDACPNTQSTGIKHNAILANAFNVYPNPGNGVFQFELSAPSKAAGEINIHDLTGRFLYSQKTTPAFFYKTTLDISKYNSGVYFVEYRTVEGYAVKKVTIQ